MFGFAITINGKVVANNGDICYKNNICSNKMIKKFEQDKIFKETDNYIIILDGVVTNKNALLIESKCQWSETILRLYECNGLEFFRVLRGSFSGALYDKTLDRWIIFGDQLGTKFTYYAKVGDFFCCSEVMGHMYHMLKENGIAYNLSAENSMLLLTYGFMIGDKTLCKEIKKINPGCYITYQSGILEEHRYYQINNVPNTKISEIDAIELIDHYFRQAVTREFEKDKEYGYKHIVALSGGLDCRMTSFVAQECGYTDQLNLTFSQTDYWDQTLPMKMAAAMKHEWLFKSLDNGLWLYDVDNVTRVTGGNVLYYGSAHGNSLYKYLNYNQLGLIHSGQLGDVVLATTKNRNNAYIPYVFGEGAYSKKYLSKIHLENLEDYNNEVGMFYFRYLNGTNNGLQIIYNYTESLSPFLDLDFLERVLSIPVELRQNHRIYKKWILDKYPQAAKYEWETTGRMIDAPVLRIGEREVPLANLPKSIIAHLSMAFGIKEKKRSSKAMNPIAYYINCNNDLRVYLNHYFDYVDSIEDCELKEVVKDIQINGTSMEKIQAVSLLAAINMFFH